METLNGAGSLDEHFLDDTNGRYRAMTVRTMQPDGSWSIWWFDGRFAGVGPPVLGRFEGKVGTFTGHDEIGGRPIVVRFVWRLETPDRLRWEQSFSADIGANWERNWIMFFDRVKS